MPLLESAHFNQFEQGIFDSILHSLTSPHDPWLTIADFRAFIDAVEAKENRIRASYAEAIRTHRITLAAEESARTGRIMRLEEEPAHG